MNKTDVPDYADEFDLVLPTPLRAWRDKRQRLQVSRQRSSVSGGLVKKKYNVFKFIVTVAYYFVGLFGVTRALKHLALSPVVNVEEFRVAGLPPSFTGYRILHLSDFHLDCLPDIVAKVSSLLANRSFDLCVMTGDYQDSYDLDPAKIKSDLRNLIRNVSAKKVVATLGNHDSDAAVEVLQDLGVQVLNNETLRICRGNDHILLTGLDDIHYFYTEASEKALAGCPDGFKILAVHSPELYHKAAEAGYKLYLTGHTHGGQVCLPGGVPIISHANVPRCMIKGRWRYRSLQGYTNVGVGTSGLPIRFACPPEIAIINLLPEVTV